MISRTLLAGEVEGALPAFTQILGHYDRSLPNQALKSRYLERTLGNVRDRSADLGKSLNLAEQIVRLDSAGLEGAADGAAGAGGDGAGLVAGVEDDGDRPYGGGKGKGKKMKRRGDSNVVAAGKAGPGRFLPATSSTRILIHHFLSEMASVNLASSICQALWEGKRGGAA